MKVLLVGATGRLGPAAGEALTGRGHQVVTVGRTAGDVRADVADPEQTARVFAEVGGLDAVASAAGDVPYERAAAIEIAPQRVDAVSPTVFTESMAEYGHLFPGSRPSVWTWRPRPTSGPSRVPRPARCSACSDRAPGPSAGLAGTREDGPVPALRGRAARLRAGRRRRR